MSNIKVRPLRVYKGDYTGYVIRLRSIREFMSVTKINFVSHGLGLDKDFTKSLSSKLFYLEFSAEDTSDLNLGEYTFDITIEYDGTKPVSKCGIPIKVLRKINTEVNC